jgi:periplasmic divalent cation tolerance protein
VTRDLNGHSRDVHQSSVQVDTAGDAEWLLGLTRSLVADRLAACGQHVLSIRSVYRWQGTIEDEGEARVALHTGPI